MKISREDAISTLTSERNALAAARVREASLSRRLSESPLGVAVEKARKDLEEAESALAASQLGQDAAEATRLRENIEKDIRKRMVEFWKEFGKTMKGKTILPGLSVRISFTPNCEDKQAIAWIMETLPDPSEVLSIKKAPFVRAVGAAKQLGHDVPFEMAEVVTPAIKTDLRPILRNGD